MRKILLLLFISIIALMEFQGEAAMYVLGFNGDSWIPGQQEEMTETSDGVYTITHKISSDIYFCFIDTLAYTWTEINNGHRFGSNVKDVEVELGNPLSVVKDYTGNGSYHFKGDGGCFTLTYNTHSGSLRLTQCVKGDVNVNEEVNSSDITSLISDLLNEKTIYEVPTADVNGDENINTSDIAALTSIILSDPEVPVAQIQIANMKPQNPYTVGSHIYYIVLNGDTIGDGSGLLGAYNYAPSRSIGLFYTVKAGNVTFKFLDYNKVEKYSNSAYVAAGSKQMLVVYDYTKEPKIIPYLDPPTYLNDDSTDVCSVRFCNFAMESRATDGTLYPMQDKIQFALQDRTDKTKYNPVGTPVAFGEATEYISVDIEKSEFNSSGYYEKRYMALYRVKADGTKELLKYNRLNGGDTADFTDYWNWYIGRAYMDFGRGILTDFTYPFAVSQITIK